MIERLEARVQMLTQEIELSAARHNALVGSLNEAKYVLEEFKKEEKECPSAEEYVMAGGAE